MKSLGTLNLVAKRAVARALMTLEPGRKIVHSKQLWTYLEEIGWFDSRATGVPVDSKGREIPWITYPALWFLESRVTEEMSVFEYGSGHSTLWWATRVRRLVSCEHDPAWFETLRDRLPSSVEFLLRKLEEGSAYRDAVTEFSKEFHLVVIDGRDRVACAKNALEALRRDGVLIWDDSHRERYQPGCAFLQSQGWKRLDFEGLTPLGARRGCTSVFYRDPNCLGL